MVSMDKVHDLKDSFRGADLKLFVRDVRDRQGRKRPITVRTWSTIKDVKDTIQQAIHVKANSQRLYFGPLLTSGKELPNHRTLHDAGIYRSGETILLDIKGGTTATSSFTSSYALHAEAKSDIGISSSVIDSTPRLLKQLVQQARRAFALGLKPEFILDGSGGSYFLHDARKCKISVFKPADEEPYAANNPRGYLPQAGQQMALREGVVPGEACIREVAAFMLDHGGFSGVPMTTLVEARHPNFSTNGTRLNVSQGGASIGAHSIGNQHGSSSTLMKKVGSFQEFIRAECSMDDLSPSKLSVDEVHKIAILDIRLMNADRNSANLLCRRRPDNSIELVPIDHGFCLRSVADVSWMDWCWLDWPQMKQPVSEKTKRYIMSLDIEKDARLLKERLNIGRQALDFFCASSSILKAGISNGLTLYDIAVMCCRNDNMGEIPSKLEVLFSMAAELAESAIENGRWHHAAASRALAEQLSPVGGGSLLSATKKGSLPKSASALSLPHYSQGLSSLAASSKRETPGLVPSSASDSSSDTGELEREDCEEWAASLILDVSLDRSMSLINTKRRSASIESDYSSDSSQGFWHVRPGSPTPSDDFDVGGEDDDSISWDDDSSFPESRVFDMSGASLINQSLRSYNPFNSSRQFSSDLPELEVAEQQPSFSSRRASLVFSDFPKMDSSFQQFRNVGKVSFAEPSETKTDLSVDPRFKHSNSDVGEIHKLPVPKSNMKRSQSYSALSGKRASVEKVYMEEESSINRPVDQEQYRDYFLKFIDLVIVRETTAASRAVKV